MLVWLDLNQCLDIAVFALSESLCYETLVIKGLFQVMGYFIVIAFNLCYFSWAMWPSGEGSGINLCYFSYIMAHVAKWRG